MVDDVDPFFDGEEKKRGFNFKNYFFLTYLIF